jgi:PleD family two-component response regulator
MATGNLTSANAPAGLNHKLREGCVLAATVLVAEDDADILRFVEVNLRLEGFEVVTARDGPDALAKAAARPARLGAA